MKLDRSIFGVALALSVVCGCSAGSAPIGTAPRTASNATSTTTLTSADSFAMKAPKVGKAQLVADEDLGGGGSTADDADELSAPKEPRRPSRHSRGGSFGSSK